VGNSVLYNLQSSGSRVGISFLLATVEDHLRYFTLRRRPSRGENHILLF